MSHSVALLMKKILTVVSQRTVGGYMDILLITILQEIILRQKWMSLDLIYYLWSWFKVLIDHD